MGLCRGYTGYSLNSSIPEIIPIILPYRIPYITPFLRSLDYSSLKVEIMIAFPGLTPHAHARAPSLVRLRARTRFQGALMSA